MCSMLLSPLSAVRLSLAQRTVGTKIIADPEKCFQELTPEKLLNFLAGWALFGINYRFQ